MQFGRESGNHAGRRAAAAPLSTAARSETKGWVCTNDPAHFRKED
jgi:hypothetical protein